MIGAIVSTGAGLGAHIYTKITVTDLNFWPGNHLMLQHFDHLDDPHRMSLNEID